MRCLITKSIMPASIAEAREQFAPLQVDCGVKTDLFAIFHDTRNAFFKLGWDSTYMGVSVDVYNAFNKASRAEILQQTVTHYSPLIRVANALYEKFQPSMR